MQCLGGLAMVLVVIPEVVMMELIAIVNSDMVVAMDRSECETRGWGVSWGVGVWPGSQCQHLEDTIYRWQALWKATVGN